MERFIKTITDINFRSQPSVTSSIIKIILKGTIVKIFYVIPNTTFFKAELNGIIGYVSSNTDYSDEYIPSWVSDTQKLLDYSQKYVDLHTAYVFGSDRTNDKDFDCSDFMQWIYGHVLGIKLAWTSRAESLQGVAVDLKDIRSGDLLFFALPNGYIHHVSMFVSGGMDNMTKDRLLHTYKVGVGVTYSNFEKGSYWRDSSGLFLARRFISG